MEIVDALSGTFEAMVGTLEAIKKVIVEIVRDAVEMLEAGVDIQEAVMRGATDCYFGIPNYCTTRRGELSRV